MIAISQVRLQKQKQTRKTPNRKGTVKNKLPYKAEHLVHDTCYIFFISHPILFSMNSSIYALIL